MNRIQFHTAENTPLPFNDKKHYSHWLSAVALAENKYISKIDYIFCSDAFLKQINIEYLNHDYYTDIITFPYKEGDNIESDIYISTDRVKENAHDYGVAFEEELRRVMVHVLLHLIGYYDVTDEESALMRVKEDFYIADFENSKLTPS